MRYVLYARKSSESEDRQIQSIEDQLRVLREFAAERQLNVIEEITESKSAKAPGQRPGFERLVKMIEKGQADAILCWSVNRLTRNPVDGGKLSWLLQKRVLLAIQTPEKVYLPEDNVLLFSVETATANQYILDLKKNVERGTKTRILRGWAPNRAPEGYVNNFQRRCIEPDPERFALLHRAWRLLLAGTHTPAQVIHLLNEEWGYRTRVTVSRKSGIERGGAKLSRSAGYSIFSNIFYAGYFRYDGQTYKGGHTPMITLSEFEEVQSRLHRQRGKGHFLRHDFAYRGLIRCSRCARAVTGERQKGRSGKGDWVYYRCTRCTKAAAAVAGAADGSSSAAAAASLLPRCIREDVLEARIDACLAQITITEEFQQIVRDLLERWIKEEFGSQESEYKSQMKALAESEKMLNELLDMRLKGLVDDALYQAKRRELTETVSRLRVGLGKTQERLDRTREVIGQALDFRLHARQQFLSGDLEKRREIARALGVRYVLDAGRVFIEMNPLLTVMQPGAAAAGAAGSSGSGPLEPPKSGSHTLKETLSNEKVSFGGPQCTELEPQTGQLIWKALFRLAAEGRLSFARSSTGAW